MRNPPFEAQKRKKRENSFQVAGPKLFNSLPKKLRNLKGCGIEIFKQELDAYLSTVPDEPKIGGLMPLNSSQSNSIEYQVKRVGEKLNCNQNNRTGKSLTATKTNESKELNCNKNSPELNCNKTNEIEELNCNQNSE